MEQLCWNAMRMPEASTVTSVSNHPTTLGYSLVEHRLFLGCLRGIRWGVINVYNAAFGGNEVVISAS
jgi:hypothetical protein